MRDAEKTRQEIVSGGGRAMIVRADVGQRRDVDRLMHYYAVRLAKEGVTANAVSPALIETEMIASNQTCGRI